MSNPVGRTRPGRPSHGGTTYRLSTFFKGDIVKPGPVVIGAGVAGVACALALLDNGLDPIILEQRSPQKLYGGAGINLQAKAIEALNSFGVSTSTLVEAGRVIKKQAYYTPDGRHVGTLDKSKSGIGSVPGQIGIHRGKLVQLLLDVAISRDIKVLYNHHVSSIDQMSSPDKITIKAAIRSNAIPLVVEGSMVIGADGINSLARRYYVSGNRNKDPLHYHGTTHYRGVVEGFPSFLDGSTMILSGGVDGVKAVVYPIGNPSEEGLQTINWVLAVKEDELNPDSSTYCEHIVKLLRATGVNLGFLDVESLITKTQDIQAWPMVDLDPLDTWTDARIALSGDAAHGMLPVGSGGAMAALLDALALREAFEKNETAPTSEILRIYEQMRYKDATLHQGKCRLQPAETIVQEAMDKVPANSEVPPEYEERIQQVMKSIHNPNNTNSSAELVIALGVSKGIITEEQAAALKALASNN